MTLTIDHSGSEPPFEQLRRQISEGVAAGTLAPGHKLATVRALAEQLDLAPNTVAKSYRALEADGVIETHGRKGTFIAARRLNDTVATEAAKDYAQRARRQGLSKDEALRLVEQHWAL